MFEPVAHDRPELLAALSGAGLPTADLALPGRRFFRWVEGGVAMGYVGLERYGSAALLRSLVVEEAFKGRGLGRRLVAAAVEVAKADGVGSLWLLTTTADGFFRCLGWQVRDRSDVPDDVARSEEFRSLCPVSAVCMSLGI